MQAVDYHPAFGFNYDPSHFGYQGVDYIKFIYQFKDRIFHVHMKDVAWGIGDGTAGVFGGHVDFHKPSRYWDFKSVGRGNINFERIIRALNDVERIAQIEESALPPEKQAVLRCCILQIARLAGENG